MQLLREICGRENGAAFKPAQANNRASFPAVKNTAENRPVRRFLSGRRHHILSAVQPPVQYV
ncbi:hypothetical protein A6M21_05555 [Desulfotomaculum copahuensis]|uniref:Uncharacterized protein n=1 Tax=Desulfotomaculum copahuensis TaxID=1838280 RepID=A0A1B7LHA4_9FIRM|nr:hypothetical protein A6M21_05555 [Desulfotomaculum copahuensis]